MSKKASLNWAEDLVFRYNWCSHSQSVSPSYVKAVSLSCGQLHKVSLQMSRSCLLLPFICQQTFLPACVQGDSNSLLKQCPHYPALYCAHGAVTFASYLLWCSSSIASAKVSQCEVKEPLLTIGFHCANMVFSVSELLLSISGRCCSSSNASTVVFDVR